MKTWLKILIILVVLGIIAAGLTYKYVYNKPHRDYEKAKPDQIVTSEQLFNDYRNNLQTAREKYTGKVVQLTGLMKSVETPDSLTIGVFSLDQGMFGDEGIRCTMLPKYAGRLMEMAGQKITIKGYCTGYNDTDVILEKCSIINPK